MEISVCYVTEVERVCSLHLALPPTTTSQEEGDYGNRVCTVNFVSKQASRQAQGVQCKAVHLALSTLGLQVCGGLHFMWSFIASLLLCAVTVGGRGQVKDKG